LKPNLGFPNLFSLSSSHRDRYYSHAFPSSLGPGPWPPTSGQATSLVGVVPVVVLVLGLQNAIPEAMVCIALSGCQTWV